MQRIVIKGGSDEYFEQRKIDKAVPSARMLLSKDNVPLLRVLAKQINENMPRIRKVQESEAGKRLLPVENAYLKFKTTHNGDGTWTYEMQEGAHEVISRDTNAIFDYYQDESVIPPVHTGNSQEQTEASDRVLRPRNPAINYNEDGEFEDHQDFALNGPVDEEDADEYNKPDDEEHIREADAVDALAENLRAEEESRDVIRWASSSIGVTLQEQYKKTCLERRHLYDQDALNLLLLCHINTAEVWTVEKLQAHFSHPIVEIGLRLIIAQRLGNTATDYRVSPHIKYKMLGDRQRFKAKLESIDKRNTLIFKKLFHKQVPGIQ